MSELSADDNLKNGHNRFISLTAPVPVRFFGSGFSTIEAFPYSFLSERVPKYVPTYDVVMDRTGHGQAFFLCTISEPWWLTTPQNGRKEADFHISELRKATLIKCLGFGPGDQFHWKPLVKLWHEVAACDFIWPDFIDIGWSPRPRHFLVYRYSLIRQAYLLLIFLPKILRN